MISRLCRIHSPHLALRLPRYRNHNMGRTQSVQDRCQQESHRKLYCRHETRGLEDKLFEGVTIKLTMGTLRCWQVLFCYPSIPPEPYEHIVSKILHLHICLGQQIN
jgi:hypothetical protein